VDQRVAGEEQVAVHLLGVRLLGAGAHPHEAGEHATGAPVEDPLVQLAARAVRAGVVDPRVGVREPRPVHHEQAVQHALPALGLEGHVDVVAADRRPEAEGVVGEAGVPPEPGGQGRDVEGLPALALELVVVDEGVVVQDDLGDRVGEVGGVLGAGPGLHDPALAAPAGDHEDARVRDGVRALTRRDVGDVDGLLQDRARGDEDHHPVDGEGGVEVGEDAGALAHERPEIRLDPLGAGVQEVEEAVDLDGGGLGLEGRQLRGETTVHQDDLRSR
jgi:hypothetical protein